ncbi:uncharacterized protein LOC126899262 isoform X8 [Daktulosphaira vitifoliae]|uniref:uncharacterized protein LOC126899262 isoform X6 n=1 Tax=Daktulosphaira vitifoliae TaxID=58002 RepID=UPI0021AA7602|nr:uncharacterized protein LOC126899262 isoform X6 [Daktulosphaira vitifoliae]XP_050529927.1 uncharacterized protein LOC126899262 isoform X7 [Daktulosphaira vitifoliae]XP_050529928.1 uncharacterized protein LOC126899262 isoform X8 [Daktulosphaira vitifoliae]
MNSKNIYIIIFCSHYLLVTSALNSTQSQSSEKLGKLDSTRTDENRSVTTKDKNHFYFRNRSIRCNAVNNESQKNLEDFIKWLNENVVDTQDNMAESSVSQDSFKTEEDRLDSIKTEEDRLVPESSSKIKEPLRIIFGEKENTVYYGYGKKSFETNEEGQKSLQEYIANFDDDEIILLNPIEYENSLDSESNKEFIQDLDDIYYDSEWLSEEISDQELANFELENLSI